MRLIGYVIQKGTCTFEQLQQFSTDVRQARFLFNEDIETYLQKLRNEGLALYAGEKKREALNPSSEEYEKSAAAWHDRLIWFTEQFSEVKKRFDPFLQIQEWRHFEGRNQSDERLLINTVLILDRRKLSSIIVPF